MLDVRRVRESRGWSQGALAGWLGVSQSLVAHWERGSREPSAEQASRLWGLERRVAVGGRLDPYPSAPLGGLEGSRGAEERLVWVNARNRLIQAGVGG